MAYNCINAALSAVFEYVVQHAQCSCVKAAREIIYYKQRYGLRHIWRIAVIFQKIGKAAAELFLNKAVYLPVQFIQPLVNIIRVRIDIVVKYVRAGLLEAEERRYASAFFLGIEYYNIGLRNRQCRKEAPYNIMRKRSRISRPAFVKGQQQVRRLT